MNIDLNRLFILGFYRENDEYVILLIDSVVKFLKTTEHNQHRIQHGP
jgi:hypothetical protein